MSYMRAVDSTPELQFILLVMSMGEGGVIPSVVGRCDNIERHTRGEGGLLDDYGL